MKTCVYCGKKYPDDVSTCLIDGQALATSTIPEINKPSSILEVHVNVSGRIYNSSEPTAIIRRIIGNSYFINTGFAKLVIGDANLRLQAMGGSYNIKYYDIKRLEKKWWWWEMDWESANTAGQVRICSWNLKPFVNLVREKISKTTINK